MSSTMNVFVHAIRKRSKKCFAQKVGRFGSPGWLVKKGLRHPKKRMEFKQPYVSENEPGNF